MSERGAFHLWIVTADYYCHNNWAKWLLKMHFDEIIPRYFTLIKFSVQAASLVSLECRVTLLSLCIFVAVLNKDKSLLDCTIISWETLSLPFELDMNMGFQNQSEFWRFQSVMSLYLIAKWGWSLLKYGDA